MFASEHGTDYLKGFEPDAALHRNPRRLRILPFLVDWTGIALLSRNSEIAGDFVQGLRSFLLSLLFSPSLSLHFLHLPFLLRLMAPLSLGTH